MKNESHIPNGAANEAPARTSKHTFRSLAGIVLAVILMVVLSIGLWGCADGSSDGSQAEQSVSTEEGTGEEGSEADSEREAHGSRFEKVETINVNTNFAGDPQAIAVSEWIKNPDELSAIEDESLLQAIAPDDDSITFTQEGNRITWDVQGKDLTYSGLIDKELPFDIDYEFKLDGQAVDPATLENVTGELEVTISYKNLTSGSVNVNGTTYAVQQPYMMASMVAFDSAYASNIDVTNGTVMDQEGSFIVIGVGMPGLAESLGLEDQVDLPTSVTISADVVDFDMPDITTMVTDQALSMIDGETTSSLEGTINDAFGSIGQLQQGLEALSQGNEGIATALTQIAEGQDKLNQVMPNVGNGLEALAQGSEQVDGALQSATSTLQQSQDSQSAALKSLQSIETDGLTDEQAKALKQAQDQLQAANQQTAAGQKMVEGAQGGSAAITQGLNGAQEGIAQISSGSENLATALGATKEGATKLSEVTKTLSETIGSAISQMQNTITSKIDLVEALSAYASDQPAFGGSASNLPSSTTFTVTASRE